MRTEKVRHNPALDAYKTPNESTSPNSAQAIGDVFEPGVLSTSDALRSLRSIQTKIASIEKLAHSIGEDANEAWIQIWSLKGQLEVAFKMFDSHIGLSQKKVDHMRREISAINVGLAFIQSVRLT